MGLRGRSSVTPQVTEHQQQSAYVIREMMQGPRWRDIPPPLDQIDHVTLVAEVILHSIAQVGIGGHASEFATLEGCDKEDLIWFLSERIEEQLAFFGYQPPEEKEVSLYAARLMDQLLRHGRHGEWEPPRIFGKKKPFQFEIFRTRYAAGDRVVIIASPVAANAVFQCLSNDISDVAIANQHMLIHQLAYQDYDRVASHMRTQLSIARTYRAEILQLLNRVRYQSKTTSWSADLQDTVERVRTQAETVIDQDNHIRIGLISAYDVARDEDRPKVADLERMGTQSFSRHSEISAQAINLREEFNRIKAERSMRPPVDLSLHDHEEDILMGLMASSAGSFGGSPLIALDLLEAPELPVSLDPVFWLSRLLLIQQRPETNVSADEDADYDQVVEVQSQAVYSEQDEIWIDERLLEYAVEVGVGRQFLLSDFLAMLERAKAPEKMLHLAVLFVKTIFMNSSERWQVALTSEDNSAPLFSIPSVSASGHLVNASGRRMVFESTDEAAEWLEGYKLAQAIDIDSDGSDGRIFVKAKLNYPLVRVAGNGSSFEAGRLYGDNFTVTLLDPDQENFIVPGN